MPRREHLADAASSTWCNPCPITRKAASLDLLTPPKAADESGRRELEQFCRAEARGALGLSEHRTCCMPDARGCERCRPGEKALLNISELRWPVEGWLTTWAALKYPAEYEAVKDKWQCSHPFCSGKDREHFP